MALYIVALVIFCVLLAGIVEFLVMPRLRIDFRITRIRSKRGNEEADREKIERRPKS